MNKKRFVRSLSIAVLIAALASQAVLYFFFKFNVIPSLIITLGFAVAFIVLYFSIDSMLMEENKELEKKLNQSTNAAFQIGKIGLLVYSEDYQITWMSEFFSNNNINHVGEKVLNWIPELQDMLLNEVDTKVIIINDEKFEIHKINNSNVLLFKDITNQYDLENKLSRNAYVIGAVSYDNYDETTVSEDESTYVNTFIKTPVIEYFKKFNCIYKTLKNNRLYLILNEEIYEKLYEDKFSILKEIRNVSSNANLDVTLSIAFAKGSDSISELDETIQSLLELAQTRGGDQVVVRKVGEEINFFGGNSEAREKLNKTKVRVNANTIKDLVNKSSKVLIVGHKNADADCVGAAIAMSNIVLSLDKPSYIVMKTGDIETTTSEALNKYQNVIYDKHIFIDEKQALDIIDNKTLVVMVDHHSKEQSNASSLLENASQIIVLDHHRRKADLDIDALMFYCEPSASSTCEIICEFFSYVPKKLKIEEEEANIIYLGILIDTDRFRVRTGIRTFDVLKQLKQYGANPAECEELMQEPYNSVVDRSNIISLGKEYVSGVVISAAKDGIYPRAIASQACDSMVKAKDIDAAFVICNDGVDETMISARSNGKINVQVILEKLNGGGHMTAAGLQRKDTSVEKLEAELIQALNEYFKGDNENESNSIE